MTEGSPSIKDHLRIFTIPGAGTAKVDVAAKGRLEAVARAGFDVPATLRGNTSLFRVYYETNDVNGPALADAVLAVCDRDYQTIQGIFGGVTPSGLPFNIIVGQGFGGAFHWGCGGVDLYCDSDINNIDLVRMLVVAEEVEVFSNSQGKGWNCGQTNGEGLSRVLAEALYPDEPFVIASVWLDQGRPDYITANEPGQSDRDTVSNACGVLFLNWLHYQLGFGWNQIVQAGGSSLAQTYTNLTGQTDALNRFKTLMQIHYPQGTPSGLRTNNPFPLYESADLGGVDLTSAPAAVSRNPNRIDVFYRGPNNHLWTSWWDGGPWWSAPADLGGVELASAPAAVSRNPNRIDVFYRGPNNHLWTSWWDGGPWWSAPADLGGVELASAPAAVSRNPNRIDVFYRGPNNHLWTSWWDGGPWWSAPADLGGVELTSAPAAVSRNPNRIDVFYRGPNNHLWTSWWDGGPWWSAPADLGGVDLASGPGAVARGPHRTDVFYIGPNNHLWVSWWDGGPWWSAPADLGGVNPTSEPAAVSRIANRVEVFYRGPNNHLWLSSTE